MCGQSERTQIVSLLSRIPTEFRTWILRNNENKVGQIELILKYIKEQKDDCLSLLNSEIIVFSIEDNWVRNVLQSSEHHLHLFIYLCIYSFIYLFIYLLFIYLFIYSFIYLFIYMIIVNETNLYLFILYLYENCKLNIKNAYNHKNHKIKIS